ncbi:hypothetical protein GH733_013759 [Mirounga leonina]|nr:hypothetical protein GH733_013759 [Mirounga leonina]
MKGALGSPVAAAAAGAAMQESFGCVVANRFHQLLDDESDPFDILREAEHRRQQQLQRKRRDEAAAAGAGNRGGRSPAGASGHRPGAGGGRRESQKERKSLPAPGAQQPDSPGGGPLPPGTRAPPGTWAPPGRRGGREGKENGVTEVTPPRPPLDPHGGPDPETEGVSGKAWVKLRVLVAEEAVPSDLSLAGQRRAPRRGEQQGWNDIRGTEVTLDRAERRSYREYRPYETERQADFTPEKFTDEKPIDRFDRDRPLRGRGGPRGAMRSRGRGGPGNRAFDGFDQRGKRDFERAIRTEDNMGGCGVRTWGSGKDTRVPELELEEETQVQEMTLDEWKNLQEQTRPKPEFNIRKPESTVPSKAVVIHKSKYRDDCRRHAVGVRCPSMMPYRLPGSVALGR